ncbi:MAG: NAD(P)/FAD-dependent oxidoreductase [Pseudomonadota bacterium]
MSTPDLVVIGAGPAGLAGASLAAERGLSVLVLDEQSAPGGQIWRGIEAANAAHRARLGKDYGLGRSAVTRFRRSGARYVPGTTVWQLDETGEIGCTVGGRTHLFQTSAVLVATGAQERPFPVAGWELPGVMGAGAAQVLLKTGGLLAERAVLAGSGPLLYLLAVQYLAAGHPPAAILDTTPPGAWRMARRHLPGALKHPLPLLKGLGWLNEIRRARVPWERGVSSLVLEGSGHVDAVRWEAAGGRQGRIETDHVFLHQGVVPSVNLTMAAGLDHDWDEGQLCWRPRTDDWGRSSAEPIHIAGDGGGIAGWEAAAATGEIATLDILHLAGSLREAERNALADRHRRRVRGALSVRPLLDALYRPQPQFMLPSEPATVICRCEEIARQDLEPLIGIGVLGPNQLKSFSRAGMGPCQGRLCGLTVQRLISECTGRGMAETGYYRLRPPVKPVPLGAFADMDCGNAP